MEKVLSSGSGRVLKRTVALLPAAEARRFFESLVNRLRRTPARAASLLPWLFAMLTQHASVLAAAPSSRSAMTMLAQLSNQRTALLGPMIALQGRLDVLVAASQSTTTAGEEGGAAEPFTPLVCFSLCFICSTPHLMLSELHNSIHRRDLALQMFD
jgi:hypothetical protein